MYEESALVIESAVDLAFAVTGARQIEAQDVDTRAGELASLAHIETAGS